MKKSKEKKVQLGIDFEEGYEIVKSYVRYFMYDVTSFYSLKYQYSKEDIEQECILKFLKGNFFEKYDSRKCSSVQAFIKRGVYTTMIDLLRRQTSRTEKYKEINLDTQIGDDLTIEDTLADKQDLEYDVNSKVMVSDIIDILPDDMLTDDRVSGNSPVLGECKISMKAIVKHLELGYTPTEIAKFYYNSQSKKSISTNTLRSQIKKIREYVSNNININDYGLNLVHCN